MKKLNRKLILLITVATVFLGSCALKPNYQVAPPDKELRYLDPPGGSKDIIIFFDGTANNWKSRTNVRRLYELVVFNASSSLRTLYIDGVGNADSRLLGSALGFGMKPRILLGLQFLIENYEDGDQVYFFGYSRGAHQARALAGMISYCGIPLVNHASSIEGVLNQFWDVCREIEEISQDQWESAPAQVLPIDFLGKRVAGLESRWAPIQFIGVWDTIPGSSFKDYDDCIERPDRRAGTRYKTGSYPNIKYIAHAVAIDEMRPRYRPLLLCDPSIEDSETTVAEAWFPGVHSDVGGGYKDSAALSGISLNWMIDLLEEHSSLPVTFPKPFEDIGGLAHSPVDSWFWRLLGTPVVRDVPADACQHYSVAQRAELDEVPIKRKSDIYLEQYSPTVLISRECDF